MHPLLRAAADRQLGLFTATDARRAGYEHTEIRRNCSTGVWARLRRGVYATTADLAALEARGRRHQAECLAVLLDLDRPRTAISHGSAAVLWGLLVRRGAVTDVRLTDPALSRRGRGFRIVQAPLRPGEIVRSGQIRLTSTSRTLLDCAREWDLEDAVVAMDDALRKKKVTLDQLRDGAATMAGWARISRATRAVALTDGRAESPLESRGRLRLVGAGLVPDELQVEIRSGGRLVGVVDAWFEHAAVAVEFDGQIKYTDPWRNRSPAQVLWDEKRREDELRALDIRVVRIAEADLGGAWQRTEERLRDLLAAPGPSRRRFTATRRLAVADRAG
ncbi:type IV toxin-antitoxin system AbiEi family antitoxin domain-containing protein [Blastococcus sp. PRF04-17]|uniref:type IV toxin-antitoxin system AbiEi family antitoxin domain-containing protein n=1 Tax=Blastococcus sp. PRF04-17 TaxID=2933797 RepID=UPI001FF60D5C|nr:type IV toxin-antitoxin system AbiEi family antitoxin domain-containing protein [Blastococcus sp. PRF04-17]UOY00797.1 type IV toxin-antitoxin system AbiEi family antitoxin domain-containing protein [Blastococcus sp. PRF04-17]